MPFLATATHLSVQSTLRKMMQNVNYGFQFQEIEFLFKNKANGYHLHTMGFIK